MIEFDDTYKTKNGLSIKGKKLYQNLQDYKEWLLSLKIIDPACGSGAFLNQSLNYLIDEHKNIDDIIAELTGTPLRLFDTEKIILENNFYGVDINEESVEIAKLSLWLRTAQKGRKLSVLSSNIKCGNSLLGTSFNWNDEFTEIMNSGGFDVVIGNPPYIKEYTNKSAFDGLHEDPCYQGKMDLWYLFGSLALNIVKKDDGLIGYIAPNNWITNSGASKFRNIILNKGKLIEFIDFGDFKVFDSAGIQTMIYIMKRTKNNDDYTLHYSKVLDKRIKHSDVQLLLERIDDNRFEYFNTRIQKNQLINHPINFINGDISVIINKIKSKQNYNFKKEDIGTGIDVHQDFVNKKNQELLGDNYKVGDGIFILSTTELNKLKLTEKEKSLIKPFYTTSELGRFFGKSTNNLWVIYTNSSFKYPEKITSYPNLKEHLDKYKDIITSDNKPYGLHRARDERFFTGEKIISLRKCSKPTFTYTDFDCYVSQTYFSIKPIDEINLKYLIGLLNSKVISFWLKYKGKIQGELYQIDKEPILNLPINIPSVEIQNEVSDLVNSILSNLERKNDHNSLLENAKNENNFDREIHLQKEIDNFSIEINDAERKLSKVIYDLYEITDKEVNIIEKSL